jgi:hypothetical protein
MAQGSGRRITAKATKPPPANGGRLLEKTWRPDSWN